MLASDSIVDDARAMKSVVSDLILMGFSDRRMLIWASWYIFFFNVEKERRSRGEVNILDAMIINIHLLQMMPPESSVARRMQLAKFRSTISRVFLSSLILSSAIRFIYRWGTFTAAR